MPSQTPDRADHAPGVRPSALVVFFLLLALVRVLWVALYANPLPFWDQWDAEISSMYLPLVHHDFRLGTLLHRHNEHIIFFTRLVNLLLFKANHYVFNNVLECLVNAIIYALGATAFLALSNAGADRKAFLLVAAALFLVGILPSGWENFTVGFQSQFYFMIWFTLVAGALAARLPVSLRSSALLALLTVCASISMAAGALAGVLVALVLTTRALFDRTARTAIALASIMLQLVTAVLFIRAIPSLPGDAALKAHTLPSFIHAALMALSWPFVGSVSRTILLWLPVALYALVCAVRRKSPNTTDLSFFAVGAWVAMQAAAIAYARGAGLTFISWRYTDILAFALPVNVY